MSDYLVSDRNDVPADVTADAAGGRSLTPYVIAALTGGMVAITLALWSSMSGAVFFEMMRAGFVACFG